MLKLPKGLKKKKKSKKNQELFTEEELEQYKREQKAKQEAELDKPQQQQQLEHQQQREQTQAVYQPTASSSRVGKQQSEDDEWSKFKQLTTGIDTFLKKTQDNLDRIKEESFYQRIPPPKQPAPEPEATEQEPPQPELTEEERKLEALRAAVVELSESEEDDNEDADDIFNTNYTDEVASGALPLAYVPESPDEQDLGPDPFDTGYADRVIKGPEVSKRGKKIVNIGSAVQVLTGRVENVAIDKKALRRARRGPQNLLLESFDLDPETIDADQTDHPVVEAKPVLSLLDDTSDIFVDAPIDLSATLHLQFLRQKAEEEKEAERKRQELALLERDEFDELAAESLTKKEEVIVLDSSAVIGAQLVEEQNWSEFTKEAELGIVHVDDLDFEVDDTDPFNTEYVQEVVRENSIDDDDFDPRAGEEPVIETKPKQLPQETLTVVRKDLLSGSTSDLTDLSHIPVIAASESIELEIDPFDTSAVSSIVQPKETEIKYLEKELLSDTGIKPSLSDQDFDPRADDDSVLQTNANLIAERKSSLSLNITSAHKAVVFNVGGDLAIDDSSCDSKRKPVTPYYPRQSIEEAGDISDSEFDPRAATPGVAAKADLLSVGGSEIDTKVLTPATTSIQVDEGTLKCENIAIHWQFRFIFCFIEI